MSGSLWVVATPIGNLGELSPRARTTLSEIDLLACESKSVAQKLFSALAVPLPPLLTYREDNAESVTPRLLAELEAGKRVGLTGDAGTPAISDPGWRLVEACHAAGVEVYAVAGPCSVAAAASVAGLPLRRWTFFGFPPHKGKERSEFLTAVCQSEHTAVLLESTHRVSDTLKQLATLCANEPQRRLAISRELTKLHEVTRCRTLPQWLEQPPLERGEFVLTLEGRPVAPETAPDWGAEVAFLRAQGLSVTALRDYLVQFRGMGRNAAYEMALRGGS